MDISALKDLCITLHSPENRTIELNFVSTKNGEIYPANRLGHLDIQDDQEKSELVANVQFQACLLKDTTPLSFLI